MSLITCNSPPGHGGDDWETLAAPTTADALVRISSAAFNNVSSLLLDLSMIKKCFCN